MRIPQQRFSDHSPAEVLCRAILKEGMIYPRGKVMSLCECSAGWAYVLIRESIRREIEMNRDRMLRSGAVLAALLLAAGLCACGNKEKESTAAEAESFAAAASTVIGLEDPEESLFEREESSEGRSEKETADGSLPAETPEASTVSSGETEVEKTTEAAAETSAETQEKSSAGASSAAEEKQTEESPAETEAKTSEESSAATTEKRPEGSAAATETESSAAETEAVTDPLALSDGPAAGITYAMYKEMTPTEKEALRKKFDSISAYSEWVKAVKKLDEDSKQYIIVGTDDIDLGSH